MAWGVQCGSDIRRGRGGILQRFELYLYFGEYGELADERDILGYFGAER